MNGRSFDAIVLGGGAAGCVLAARLSEDAGRSVCLVEAGPDPGPLSSGRWPADLLDAHQLPVSHDWRYDDGLAWSARVIGGCSTHNACVLTWGHEDDYRWGGGWSADALEPCRRRAEGVIGMRMRESSGAWHDAVLAAAVEEGHPLLADLNASDAPLGAGPAPVNDRGGRRWNAALAYLDPARGRPNLTVLDRATADRVEIAGGRARRVHVVRDGRRLALGGGAVVLACGAYGAPAVLLRSGVGQPAQLEAAGVAPVHGLPAVGAGLQNHWTTRVLIEPGPTLARALAREAAAGGVHAAGTLVKAASHACPADCWDLHLVSICWGIRDAAGTATGEHVLRISVALMRPAGRGRVTIETADPLRTPRIEHGALADPDGADLRALADGLRIGARVARAPSLRALGADVVGPAVLAQPELEAYARESLGCYYHPVGTCAIGAVVDAGLAVRGLEGLYVADASAIPVIPRANTHLTTLALAERAAEMLRSAL